MENEINIAEILKDKPKGTKLYSPIFGEVSFIDIEIDGIINVSTQGGGIADFFFDGRYSSNGEYLLFPSKEMQSWDKFSWKKGDVLISNDGKCNVIFEKFNSGYSSFVGKHYLDCTDENNIEYIDTKICLTSYHILDTEDAAKCYINTIEERLGGKLNMETLEIEPVKPKCEFKPFDKVLGRNEGDVWEIDFFSRMADDLYFCLHGMYEQCIPYNEETAKLIGTTDNYEED